MTRREEQERWLAEHSKVLKQRERRQVFWQFLKLELQRFILFGLTTLGTICFAIGFPKEKWFIALLIFIDTGAFVLGMWLAVEDYYEVFRGGEEDDS